MSIRTLTSALGAATLAAALAVAGQSLAAPSELTIGVLPELTGPLSESGPAFEKASRLAVDVANKAAAKAGLPMTVKIAVADPQGDPQAALSAARTLIDKGAACLVGPATTPESIAILNGITMQRKITLWPTATSTRLRKVNDDHTIYRTVPADDLQAKALVMAAIDEAHRQRQEGLGCLSQRTLWRCPGEELQRQAWQAAGGK